MKKLFSAFLIAVLVFSGFTLQSASASTKVSIFVKEKLQPYSKLAVVENGNTLVPLRGIFESLGATVVWNAKDKTIDASKGSRKVWLKIGSKTAKLNNTTITLNVAPKVINGNTLVPLRFVSESLGETVKWDSSTKSIIIGNFDLYSALFKASVADVKAYEQGKLAYDNTEYNGRHIGYDSNLLGKKNRLNYWFEDGKLSLITHNFLSGQEVYYGWSEMFQFHTELNNQAVKLFGNPTSSEREDNIIKSTWDKKDYYIELYVSDYDIATEAYLVITPK